MSDRHIRRLGDSYGTQFLTYLPQGQAWPRQPGTILDLVCRGLVDYYGFVDGRAADLLETEADPRTTIELLPDWERNWGLPDPCWSEAHTVGERQTELAMRVTMLGGQSRQFFIDAAAHIGYDISISEYRPFMVGLDRCGDNRVYGDGSSPMLSATFVCGYLPVCNPDGDRVANGELSEWPNYGLGPPENRFYWQVHVHRANLVWFRVNAGQCGVDPHLRIGTADDLECLLNRWKPAHTQIIFDYSGLEPNDPMAGTP
jgi:uncharacterized protein YmfQ (DUF2313 family)